MKHWAEWQDWQFVEGEQETEIAGMMLSTIGSRILNTRTLLWLVLPVSSKHSSKFWSSVMTVSRGQPRMASSMMEYSITPGDGEASL